MSFLSRWRKNVKPKTNNLKNGTFSSKPTDQHQQQKHTYDSATFKKTKSASHSAPPMTSYQYYRYHDKATDGKSKGTATTIPSESERKKQSGKELQRSDTFTLKNGPPDALIIEPATVPSSRNKCGTYTRYKDDVIKTDVFETLYSKRPMKISTKSSRSSSESFNYNNHSPRITDFTPSHRSANILYRDPVPAATKTPKNNRSTVILNTATYKSSPTTSREAEVHSTNSTSKPREYLFGTIERTAKAKAHEKENDDKFKTITIKDVRRSFRESYLKNNKDDNEHQSIWFVNVKDEPKTLEKNDSKVRVDKDGHSKSMFIEFDQPKKRSTVSRKDTFKIIRNDSHYEDERPEKTANSSLKRRETFRVDDPIQVEFLSDTLGVNSHLERNKRNLDTIRVEINSVTDRSGKIVPVGIAAPYNSINDRDDVHQGRKRYSTKRIDDFKSLDQLDSAIGQNTKSKYYSTDKGGGSTQKSTLPYEPKVNSFFKSLSPSSATKPAVKNRFTYNFLNKKTSNSTKDLKNNTNLGFDKFYDPNYNAPKNQNYIYGHTAPSYQAVNLKILPKPRESSIRSNPNNWMYNKVHI